MDPFRSVFNAASKEKEDFVYLNDRLSDLFRKMEKMRGGGGGDCEKYLSTIACLEEEIKKLRTFYEAEISRQRSYERLYWSQSIIDNRFYPVSLSFVLVMLHLQLYCRLLQLLCYKNRQKIICTSNCWQKFRVT